MKRKLRLYLSCPYSHPDIEVRQDRYEQATMKAAALMASGYIVFSPITHSHQLVKYLPNSIKHDFNFWMSQDIPYIRVWADELWVLCLPGWKDSLGIMKEIANAFDVNIPVRLLRPTDDILQEEL